MATTPISGAPEKLTMQDFKSISEDYGGFVRACRFAAVIRPTGRFITSLSPIIEDLPYLCEAAEMPGRGLLTVDLRYYGANFKLPFQSQYEDINMTFLCRTTSLERQFFDDWLLVINPINTWDFNYRDDYRAEIDIFQFGEFGKDDGSYDSDPDGASAPEAHYKFTLHDAYPVLVNPQPVTWADADQFQRLIVAFTYSHWSRKGLDPEPSVTDPNKVDLVRGRPGGNIKF